MQYKTTTKSYHFGFWPAGEIACPAERHAASQRFPVGEASPIQRNRSRQDGGKLPGVRVVGAADTPGRLLINSIIVGVGIFFNPALETWGLYRPVSVERGQSISRLPLWVGNFIVPLENGN